MRPIGSNPPPTVPRPAPTPNPPPAGHTPRHPRYNAIDRLIGLMLEVVPAMKRTGMAVTLCADVEAAVKAARDELCGGSAEAGDRATPARPTIDGCTESNCSRCNTHPDHRADMKHAGISSADAEASMFAGMTDAQIAHAVRRMEQSYLHAGLDPQEQAISLALLRDAGRDIAQSMPAPDEGTATVGVSPDWQARHDSALETLRSLLCDPDGAVVAEGADADRMLIAGALDVLAQPVVAGIDIGAGDDMSSTPTLMGDVLSTLGESISLEAPTGRPPHVWTEQERADCAAAMQRIVEDEAADPIGHLIWQLRQMKTPLAFDRAVVEQAADALAEVRDAKRNIGAELLESVRAIKVSETADCVLAQPAAARKAAPIARAPRDGTVIRLLWGSDGIDGDSPGWWSAPLSPVAGADGLFPSTGDMAWSFIDRSGDRAFVNKAVDNEYGPTHWLPYVAPAAGAQAVAYMVDGRVEKGLTFDKAAAETMAFANAGSVRPLALADGFEASREALIEIRNRLHAMSCRVGDDCKDEANDLQREVQKIIDGQAGAGATGATSVARQFDRAVLEPMRQHQNAGRAKGGSEATGELLIWGVQKPGSMPKLCGAREIAELNWYPNEGYDLICLQVVERVPARVEIDSIRAQAQSCAPEVKA